MSNPILSWPRAYGEPCIKGDVRSTPDDFIVVENLGFEPEGDGEHLYVSLQKTSVNTDWVVERLASFAGVKRNDVGFCGLKDRHAVTTQWFSIYQPRPVDLDWAAFVAQIPAVELNTVARGRRKLRRGQHLSNRFSITLRALSGVDEPRLQALLQRIAAEGVPNYFGEQRFGRDGGNLNRAEEWFVRGKPVRQRQEKSMIMSAARSYLFNRILALRVSLNNWFAVLPGDVVEQGIPALPMWGRGRSATGSLAREIEDEALEGLQAWQFGLEHCGLQQERRATTARPENLAWSLEEDQLRLGFELPPGQYATSVLREVGHWQNQAYSR